MTVCTEVWCHAYKLPGSTKFQFDAKFCSSMANFIPNQKETDFFNENKLTKKLSPGENSFLNKLRPTSYL